MEAGRHSPKSQNENQWDQESLSSESEATLCKFDSDLSETQRKQQIYALLESYSIQERKEFIVDKNRGLILDSRNGQVVSDVSHSELVSHMGPKNTNPNTKTSRKKIYSVPKNGANQLKASSHEDVWDDYWEQSEKLHQKLLMGICQKNDQLLLEIIHRGKNSIPLNVNYKSFNNWTPLHFASLHGNLLALEMLLNSPEICLNCLTGFKESPLHMAAKNDKRKAMEQLIQAGVELNLQDQDGNTALHYLAQLGYKAAIEMLLSKCKGVVDTQIKNNKGQTAKDLTACPQITNILSQGSSMAASFRTNRHVQRLLDKVNEMRTLGDRRRKGEVQESNEDRRQKKKGASKKENLVKMYQLLREKKPVEKIGIESFKFYRKIGEGAFGEVYVVTKGQGDTKYALKAIKKQRLLGTSLMRYIQTEKEVLSLIRHPLIVQLHYAFQNETHLFLVMDYCSGGDLGQLLDKKGKFDETIVKKYAAEILLALEALHKEKIIYRDLKPSNIVLDEDGHALLTDFGLSKKTTDINDINRSFCGTPAYLPLQIINKKGHNRMADWYEYGVVLYELLTGLPPFYAESKQELFDNVRAGMVRFPKTSSNEFRDLVKKLLTQNPSKRLGYISDAESIKEHPWFSGVNWSQVYGKKQKIGLVNKKIVIGDPIKTKFSTQKSDKCQVPGWSFIAT